MRFQELTRFFFIIIFPKLFKCTLDFNYHNYTQLTSILQSYAIKYPTKTYLYSIGQSFEKRELWVLAICNDKPNVHMSLRPEVKYIGNMHGKIFSSYLNQRNLNLKF